MAFRVRAAAALDIRRTQEDAARLASATADSALELARQRANDAVIVVRQDGERLIDVQSAGAEGWRVRWHRAWIDRQRQEVVARSREVDTRATEAALAQKAAQEAVKRRRVLERLRDRASRKYQRAADEQHVREMNELATLRFVAQIAEGEHRAD